MFASAATAAEAHVGRDATDDADLEAIDTTAEEGQIAVERIADTVVGLARRNEALEDFAALVAHELKSPLEAALVDSDPRRWIVSALDLVESLLQMATESSVGAWASLAECLAEAARSTHPIDLTLPGSDHTRFPLAAKPLSIILRNLLDNAAAAHARHVEVSIVCRRDQWWLVVDDDGVGLGTRSQGDGHGSGLGLELCRRIANRNGGRIELVSRDAGGTRAILMMERAT